MRHAQDLFNQGMLYFAAQEGGGKVKPVSIRELGRVFNPAPGQKVLALLCTYLDASLNGKQPGITSVAGYVAPLTEWERVEAEWRDGLNYWGINPFRLSGLHLEPRIGMGKVNLCIRFFQRIIEQSQLNAIGAALLDKDWHWPDWGLDSTVKLSSPYEQCLNSALAVVGEHTKEHFPSERVGIVCCLDGPKGVIDAVYARNAQRYPQFIRVALGVSRDIVPLQCADLGVGQLRES